MPNTYLLHGVTTPGGTYAQLENSGKENAPNNTVIVPPGSQYPMAVGQLEGEVSFGLTTQQLDLLFTELNGALFKDLSSGSSVLYFRQSDGVGGLTAAATTSHLSTTAALSLLVLESLTASQGSPATATFRLHTWSSDGTAHPLSESSSAAVDSITVSAAELFTLDEVQLNNTSYDCTDFSINFNPEVSPIRAGHHWPIGIHPVKYTNITADVTLLDLDLWTGGDSIALDGTNGLECEFARIEADKDRYATTATQHVKLQATHGKADLTNTQQTDVGTATTLSVAIRTDTAGTAPVTFTHDVAIDS